MKQFSTVIAILMVVFVFVLYWLNRTAVDLAMMEVFDTFLVALKILFIVGVPLGVAWCAIEIKHRHEMKVIRSGKQFPAQAVMHRGEIVHLNQPGQIQMDPMQQLVFMQKVLQMHGQIGKIAQKTVVEEVIEAKEPLQIAPPQHGGIENEIIPLIEQIEAGVTQYDEDLSVFGYELGDGKVLRVPLFRKQDNFVNSLFVIGEQGNGKSVVGTYFSALTVNHGGYLLVIDPDAAEDQSLSNRLGPLRDFLLCEVADTPEKAERVLKIAEDEIDHPGEYPALLLVDEFSMIMRAKKLGGKWKEVADLVASQVENWATRGRKRRRRVVVFGQISNASRTGGTELRDVCAYLVFNTSVKKAERVLSDANDEDIADVAPMLNPGCAIVSPAKSSETYVVKFPLPDERSLKIIADVRREIERSHQVQDRFQNRDTDELERSGSENGTMIELAWEADVRRVRNLVERSNQDEIIYQLWGVRKGGSQKYKDARERYQQIVTFLKTGQMPEAREA